MNDLKIEPVEYKEYSQNAVFLDSKSENKLEEKNVIINDSNKKSIQNLQNDIKNLQKSIQNLQKVIEGMVIKVDKNHNSLYDKLLEFE